MRYQRTILVALGLLVVSMGCALCLSGCKAQNSQRELTLSSFDFLERGMDLNKVVRRVGWPDRVTGSGHVVCQYDLTDGRVIELSFLGKRLYAQVQEEDGTWIDLDLPERPSWWTMWHTGKWIVLVLVVLGIGWWIWRRCQAMPRKA